MKTPIPFIALALFIAGCAKKGQVVTQDTTHTTTPAEMSHADTVKGITASFDSTKVSVASLPDSVRPYVKAHFPGYQIATAAYDPLCGGGPAIDVSIRAKGKPNLSLIFKPNGAFVQKEEDVPLSKAPQKVLDEVHKSYAVFTPGKEVEVLTLADNSVEYLVDLTKGKLAKEVIFTPAGVVVCDSKE